MTYSRVRESLYLQISYLRQMSSSLSRFTDKGGNVFNMRCPFCGDSQRSQTKARGYVVKSPINGLLMYKCHNCGIGASFMTLLKHVDHGLYNRYRYEVFRSASDPREEPKDVMKLDTSSGLERNLEGLKCVPVNSLSRLHLASIYLAKRKIPKDKRDSIYFTENFREFCESMKNYSEVSDDPRLLLFETDKFGNIKIVVARALSEESKQRYITIRVDEEYPKVFGLSKLDTSKRCFVLEGAFDSLFLDNAIALNGAELENKNFDSEFSETVYILDNEPRSSIIVNKMNKIINSGKSIVIFDSKNEYKDINKMVQGGIDIKPYIDSRIFKGIKARMEFNKWKKV